MQSFLIFSINLFLKMLEYNSKGYWILIKYGIRLQIYLLVHVSREFWWTDSIALNGYTKVSEFVWNENHPRITEVNMSYQSKRSENYLYLINNILLFNYI